MLNLQEVKKQIEENTLSNDLIIFVCLDNDFLAHQYIQRIAKNKNQTVCVIDELEYAVNVLNDIFYVPDPTVLNVYITDTLDYRNEKLLQVNNLYVVCNKISKESEALFESAIVKLCKLEDWMYKDYVQSLAPGLSNNQVDYLVNVCNNNIYRLDNELKKIVVFDEQQQKSLFSDMLSQGLFNDLSSSTIFDLSNAILHKDKKKVLEIYRRLDCIDVEPIGLWTVLYKNIKNVILIQLDNTATAAKIGMSDKQFYAVKKYSCGYYTKIELLKIFDILTQIDKMIKTGKMPMDRLIDYLIIKTLGVC